MTKQIEQTEEGYRIEFVSKPGLVMMQATIYRPDGNSVAESFGFTKNECIRELLDSFCPRTRQAMEKLGYTA